MADKDRCLASIKALADKLGLDEKQVEDIVNNIELEKSTLDSTRPLDSEETRFNEAAQKVEDEIVRRAMKRKQDASKQLKALLKNIDEINEHFTEYNTAWGLKNFLVGVQGNVLGTKRSVAHLGDTLGQRWIRGLVSELEEAGIFKLVKDGALDPEIRAVGFEKIGRNDPDVKISDKARKAYEIIDKYKATARREENSVGGDIGELIEHTFQSWDRYRMLQDKSGRLTDRVTAKRDWMDLHREWGDFMRMLGTEETKAVDEFLSSFYDAVSSGVNLKTLGGGVKSKFATMIGSDKARVFHFKSSKGAQLSADRYGQGTVLSEVAQNIKLSALNTELMRRFGPNVRQGFEAIREYLLIQATKKQRAITDEAALKAEIKAWEKAIKKDKYLSELNDQLSTVMYSKEGRKLRKQIEKKIKQRIAKNPELAKLYKAKEAVLKSTDAVVSKAGRDMALLDTQGGSPGWFGNQPGYTLENIFLSVTGELKEGSMAKVAIIANNIRAYMAAVDLGMSVITAFGDLGNLYKEARAGGDDKFFNAPVEALKRIAGKISTTKVTEGSDLGKVPFLDADMKTPFSLVPDPDDLKNKEEFMVLKLVGGATQALASNPGMRMTGDDVLTGDVAKKMAMVFKINGLTPWTDTHRETAQLFFSQALAMRRDKSYDQLLKEKDNVIIMFREFGITPERWDLIRKNTAFHDGIGNVYLVGENIDKAPRLDVERTMAGEEVKKLGNNIAHLESGMRRRQRELDAFDAPHKLEERKAALAGVAADKKQIKAIKEKAKKLEEGSKEFEELNKVLIELQDRVKQTEKRLRKQADERTTLVEEIKKNKSLIKKYRERRKALQKFSKDFDAGRLDVEKYYDEDLFMFKDRKVEEFKREVKLDLENYFIHRSERAILAPSPDTIASKQAGFKRDSIEGIAMSFLTTYKTFAIGQTKDILARDLLGNLPPGTGIFSKEFFNYHKSDVFNNKLDSSMGEIIRFMVFMTMLGYISMSTKALLSGKEPRPISDPKVWLAALMQSGGAGIYGDLIFSPQDRFGRSPLISLLGPGAGRLDDLIRLGIKGRDTLGGDPDADFAAHALRVGMRNTPLINLFYTKMAVDYLFVHELQEAMNPGYLKRMEQRLKDMDNQEFYLRPSEVVK
jgi:hypothetical protein